MKNIQKFKIHKIPKVEKSVCCCEQMMAYNITFYHIAAYKDDFLKFLEGKPARVAVCDAVDQILKRGWASAQKSPSWETISRKYNIDVIYMCLRNGLEEYLRDTKYYYPLCNSYEAVGKQWPLVEGYSYI